MASTGYFNPNFDYSKAIEDALKVGDQRNLQTLIKEREAKIASDPAKYGNVRSTSELLEGYNVSPGTQPSQSSIDQLLSEWEGTGEKYDDYSHLQDTVTTDPFQTQLTDMLNYQQALANAQRQSRISALSKARDNALSGLDAEKATIDPYYYDKRNQAAAASDVGALNFAQYMASRGISGSAGALPEMYRNAGLQSQIGRLDTQQAAEHSDIARRRSGIESAYQSDVASANAGIDAQTMQAYIDTMRTVEAQRIADLASQGKTSTGELNLQGQQAQNSEYERQAALIAARYYDNIMAEIQRREKINPNDPLIPYLHAARREKIQTEAEQQAAAMAAASEAEQQAWENAYKSFVATGRITSAEQAQILRLPTNATAADVDIAKMNAYTSRLNAQTSAANLDYKQQQDLLAQSSQRVKQYAAQIDNLYITNQYDDEGRVIGKTFDPDVVKAYIQNLNQTGQISEPEAKQLLAMYNFSY